MCGKSETAHRTSRLQWSTVRVDRPSFSCSNLLPVELIESGDQRGDVEPFPLGESAGVRVEGVVASPAERDAGKVRRFGGDPVRPCMARVYTPSLQARNAGQSLDESFVLRVPDGLLRFVDRSRLHLGSLIHKTSIRRPLFSVNGQSGQKYLVGYCIDITKAFAYHLRDGEAQKETNDDV